MDYTGIVKRAWQITWKYRALWILGLFAGAGSGGGGGGGGRGSAGNFGGARGGGSSNLPFSSDAALRWIQSNLAAIVVIATVLILIGIIWAILSVAARGGLVWLANEAAEGRPVRAGNGWGAGFHFWGRTFLIGLLLALPLLLIALVIGALFAGTIVALAAGRGGEAAVGAGVLGICGLAGFVLIVIVPLAILIGVLDQLALRHGVLDDVPATESIRRAWRDVRGRFKDVAIMWILLLAIAVGFGIVVAIVAVAAAVPAVVAAAAGVWPLAVVLGVVALAALMFVGAVYSAFYYTAWTIFFRRLTGREVAEVPAPAPAFPGGYPPPPPPPPPGAFGYPPPPGAFGYPPPPAPPADSPPPSP
ncbi:MAG TPA: hypothetical protein VGK50_05125 [Coriobacteriia bacterium]